MKSRIKKLLAAALALCLIAAMVPGAALAASTPAKPFKVGDATYASLSEALDDPNYGKSDIELTGSYTLTQNATIDTHTLKIGDGATLTIASNAELTVNAGGTLDIGGSIVVAAGETESADAVLDVDGTITGNGSITVNGKAEFPAINDGSLSVDLSVSGAVSFAGNAEISGTVTVSNYAKLELTSGKLTIGNTFTNSGTLDANSIFVNGGATLSNSGTIETQSLEANGNLAYTGTDTIDYEVKINRDGKMTVTRDVTVNSSGKISLAGALDVSGKLDVSAGTSGLDLTDTNAASVSVSGILEVSDSYDFAGNHTFESGATLSIDDEEFLGDNTYVISDGSVGVTDVDGDTVLTIPVGSVVRIDKPYNIDTMKVVLKGDLIVDNSISLNEDMEFDGGTLTIEANNSFTVPATRGGDITGNGKVYANGWFYFEPSSGGIGGVKITLSGNGGIYSNSVGMDGCNTNGESSDRAAPNNKTYPWSRVFSSQTYTITASSTITGGRLSGLRQSAANGEIVSFVAVPNQAGYVVDRAWFILEGDSTQKQHPISVSNGTQCEFTMLGANATVYVTFKADDTPEAPEGDDYSISVSVNSNSYGTATANSDAADADETVSIIVTPASGYRVKSVTVNGSTAGVRTNVANALYTFTMPARDVSVIVTFERGEYTVTLSNPTYNDGTISLSSIGTTMTGSFAEKEDVTIYVNPDRDFYLRSLSFRVNGISTNIAYEEIREDVYSFIMPEGNVTVTAYFTDGVYEITKDIDGNGSLTITGEDGNVTDVAEEGEEIRIYPSADKGYRLGDIYVNYTDSDDEDQVIYPEVEYKNNGNVDYYWFEMPEYDVEIYADFGEGDYVAWIDRSDMKNGTIRVSPNVADEDDTVSIYVTPDTGYQLDELIVEDEDGHDVTTSSLASGTRYTFRMPDSDVTVTATFKSRSYSSNFTDVPRYEWYYEAVSYVASEGLMNGVSTTQFNPNGTASRAQIVTILWRLAGEPSALTGAFTDVPAGQYYSTAVAWASRQGIVTGVGNNRFEPNSNITREQLAVILYRYAQDAGYTTSASANITGYYDYARVNSYARTAMSWAVGAGLITGTSTTTLSPQDTATRAQVATILMRFCENIAK